MVKRILTIILAVMLAFGALSIGASAAIYDYGDVNTDKTINSSDALLALQSSTGLKTIKPIQTALADVNDDGKVNSSDALAILMFSTGKTTSFQKTDKNTLKVKNVNPVVNSKKYTIGLTMSEAGMSIDCSMATDGTSRVITASYLGIEMRFLEKSGKTYLLVPMLKAYCEMESPDMFAGLQEAMLYLLQIDGVYSKTTKEKIGTTTYDCETFYIDDSEAKYYFKGEDFKQLVVTSKGESQTFKINTFKASVDSSLLTIPNGYKLDESLKDIF